MSTPLRFALVLALFPLVGCNDDGPTEPPPPQALAGFWTGTIVQASRGLEQPGSIAVDIGRRDELEMLLAQDAQGRVAGAAALFDRRARTGLRTGARDGSDTDRAFEVGGTNAFPVVVLTFRSGVDLLQTELIYFRGEFVGVDLVEGQLIGGGFERDRVRLRRVDRPPPLGF